MKTFVQPPTRRIGGKSRRYNWFSDPFRDPWKISIRRKFRQCPICRTAFFSNHEQIWCSRECWIKELSTKSHHAICPGCHKDFIPRQTGRGLQQCCSRECAGLLARGSMHHWFKHGKYSLPKTQVMLLETVPVEVPPNAPEMVSPIPNTPCDQKSPQIQ